MNHARWTLRVGLLALGLLAPQVVRAEYDSLGSYNASTKAGAAAFSPTLSTLSGSLSGSKGASGSDSVNTIEQLSKQIDEQIKRSDEEVEKRQKLRGWRAKEAKADKAAFQLQAEETAKLKELERKNNDIMRSASKLLAAPQMQAPDLESKVRALPKECRAPGAFGGMKQLVEAGGTAPFDRLKQIATSITKDNLKQTKAAFAQEVAKLLKALDSTQKRDDEFQANIAKLDLLKQNNGLEVSLKQLDKDLKSAKEDSQAKERGLITKLGEFIQKTLDFNDNKAEVAEASGSVKKELSDYVTTIGKSYRDGVGSLFDVCQGLINNTDPFQPRHLVKVRADARKNVEKLYSVDVNPQAKIKPLHDYIEQVASSANCTDVTARGDQMLAPVQQAVNKIGSSDDFKQVIVTAAAAMQTLAQAAPKLEEAAAPLLDDCAKVSQSVATIEQLGKAAETQANQVQQQLAGQQGGQRAGVARRPGQNPAAGQVVRGGGRGSNGQTHL